MSFWKKNQAEDELPAATTPVQNVVVEPVLPAPVTTPPKPKTPEEAVELRYGSKLRTALGPGTIIQGKLSFDAPVKIDGKLSGEIFASKDLIVGKTGEVTADIHAATLIILGKVKGKIKASEGIEILSGAILEADITTPKLMIEEGAVFRGACQMTK